MPLQVAAGAGQPNFACHSLLLDAVEVAASPGKHSFGHLFLRVRCLDAMGVAAGSGKHFFAPHFFATRRIGNAH